MFQISDRASAYVPFLLDCLCELCYRCMCAWTISMPEEIPTKVLLILSTIDARMLYAANFLEMEGTGIMPASAHQASAPHENRMCYEHFCFFQGLRLWSWTGLWGGSAKQAGKQRLHESCSFRWGSGPSSFAWVWVATHFVRLCGRREMGNANNLLTVQRSPEAMPEY